MNREDFFRVAAERVRITPDAEIDAASIRTTGSTMNILTAVSSTMAEEVESRSVARFAGLLINSAVDDDLDRLLMQMSKDRLPRLGAAAALIDVQVERPTADAGEGTIPAGTLFDAGGLTWSLDQAAIFTTDGLYAGQLTATCTTLGAAGNGVASDTYLPKVPAALFDPSVVFSGIATALELSADGAIVSTGLASAGGADREKDDAYRARYALWDAGLDRNVDFLAAGALTVPGIAVATAIESLDTDGNPTGPVDLYVGDSYGRATVGLLARVRARIREFRMLGQHVRIWGTLPSYRSFVLQFGVLDTYGAADVRAAVVVALVAYVNALKPGASLLRAGIAGVIQGVPGVVLLESAPYGLQPGSVGDVDLIPSLPSTTYRTRPELVTFP